MGNLAPRSYRRIYIEYKVPFHIIIMRVLGDVGDIFRPVFRHRRSLGVYFESLRFRAYRRNIIKSVEGSQESAPPRWQLITFPHRFLASLPPTSMILFLFYFEKAGDYMKTLHGIKMTELQGRVKIFISSIEAWSPLGQTCSLF